ncbi:cell wall metabolism sensor histidine kinase WalK [Mesobacillus maritimus]|uniref:two-component system histidine kinase PnpS n=1 Tax=Mesobacillus maritimus TaxID=1643336 RepID=UPI0020411940|nr:ATP-binding protein [Mesobacillus maritimus]MCM3670022.1 cell wall metabolism sensor histidine kinase WalK [Mesobacillus maritimus]
MTKYRTRLLFALITLLITVLVGLGIVLGQLFKSHYLNNFNERLQNEIDIVSYMIEKDGGLTVLDQSQLNEIGEFLKTRITIVDSDGTIHFDSDDNVDNNNALHQHILEKALSERDSGASEGKYSHGTTLQYYWEVIEKNGQVEGYIFLASKVNEMKNAYHQLWWVLSLSLGLALVVIILLGSKITNRYTKPIESATKVAIELAKGNYRARTYEDHIDETGMLSTSINILARNLQDLMKSQEVQQDRLSALIENMGSGLILIDKRGYINLINKTYKEIFQVNQNEYLYNLYHEVIEHKEINSVIEEIFMTEQKKRKQVVLPIGIERKHFEIYGVPIISSDKDWKGVLLVFHDITELKKLEIMRKDFVANVSHELKTPITSIKGFSETLLDGAMNDKQTLESFLEIILKESDRLQLLIQDLLELSRIEQHGFSLKLQEIELTTQISEALTILKARAVEKSIQLHFQTDSPNVRIMGDADRLKQVFLNLVANAITYTPSGGSVYLEVIDKPNEAIVTVRDTGIGIEQNEISRIFERFYRVDKARSRNSGGTGLGLAIVKHIMEAHKGMIEVESKVGEGTAFILKFRKDL